MSFKAPQLHVAHTIREQINEVDPRCLSACGARDLVALDRNDDRRGGLMFRVTHELDYSRLEMRVAAESGKVSIDTETIGDIHTMNARKLFNVVEVTPELRRKAKEAMFCRHYGGNPSKVVR